MKAIAPILPVSDVAEALSYYEQALGFSVLFCNPPVFALVQRGDVRIGLQRASARMPAGSGSCYIWADDVRSLYNELRARGLEFEDDIAPRDEFELIDFVFRDPDGNHIGIGGEETPPDDGLQMTIEYVEIGVQEVETAKAFYGDLCGWTFQDYSEQYASFSHGAGHGGLNKVSPESGGYVLPVLYAHDLEAALDRVRQSGAPVSRPPFDIPGGRRFQFLDPNGNEIAIWSDDA